MKRRFKSYAECESAYDQASRNQDILHKALNDVINGNVTWFRRGAYRVGVCRPTGADGGIAMVTYHKKGQEDYTSAYYIEEWAAPAIRQLSSACAGTNNQEAIDLRDLVQGALIYRNCMLEAERGRLP